MRIMAATGARGSFLAARRLEGIVHLVSAA